MQLEVTNGDLDDPVQRQDGATTPEQIRSLDPISRVSYYVEAWQEMQDTVLSKESYLFTQQELSAINIWSAMSYPARYLFVRLFIRKNGYFRLANLSYERDIPDLQAACRELCSHRPFSHRSTTPENDLHQVIVIEDSPVPPPEPLFQSTSAVKVEDQPLIIQQDTLGRFAFDHAHLAAKEDVDELCAMLTLDELKALAKDFKVSPPKSKESHFKTTAWTRSSIVAALKKSTTNQMSLFASTAQNKGNSARKRPLWSSKSNDTQKLAGKNDLLVTKLLKIIGPAICLDDCMTRLFQRLHLIFHRCAPPLNANSLTSALLARFEKWNYPKYEISRTFTVFPDREMLIRYEAALMIEREIEEALDFSNLSYIGKRPSNTSTDGETKVVDKERQVEEMTNWEEKRRSQRKARWQHVKMIFERAYSMWIACIQETVKNEPDTKTASKDDRLVYYRKRFHPGWPLTRAIHKGSAALATFKEYGKEVKVLKAMLAQQHFRRGRRGQWWDRLALIYMEHGVPTDGSPTEVPVKLDDGSDDEITELRSGSLSQQESRTAALKVCWQGLEDPWTHLVERHALQRRIIRLESLLKVPRPERHVFSEHLNKATEVEIEGTMLGERITGKKSVWQSTIEDAPDVSVEDLCLEHYRAAGWEGHHSENSVLTTLFGLLFFDILFAPVQGAFETAYQSSPLDLATDAFRIVRGDLIAERLEAIRSGKAAGILTEVDDRERPKLTKVIGVRWSFSPGELQDFVRCIGGNALSVICRVYAEDYEHRVGGVPDLFLWKSKKDKCKFVEVKGPGDQLSKTQKVWIDVLLSAGVPVEKCNVKATRTSKRKSLQSDGKITPKRRKSS